MNIDTPWYKNFFSGLALELWQAAIPEAVTDAEVDFIVNQCNLKPGERVLDVPCGFGRHTVALAKRGINVTGIDIAQQYVDMVVAQKKESNMPIDVQCADLLELDIPSNCYHAAICMGNSFSYFPYDDMVRFARKVFKSLKSNGQFIINTGSLAETMLPAIKPHEEMEFGAIRFILDNEYEAAESVLKTRMTFLNGNRKEEATSFHYAYGAGEVSRILRTAGFRTISFFADVNRTPFKLGDQQAYIVAAL